MKAFSAGLETDISLTSEEIEKMENHSIKSILRFRGVGDNDEGIRKIPISITVKGNQKDYVKVKIFPEKTYFGKADRINFSIDSDYYRCLKKYGAAEGARFFTSTGKLNLYSENSPSEHHQKY